MTTCCTFKQALIFRICLLCSPSPIFQDIIPIPNHSIGAAHDVFIDYSSFFAMIYSGASNKTVPLRCCISDSYRCTLSHVANGLLTRCIINAVVELWKIWAEGLPV